MHDGKMNENKYQDIINAVMEINPLDQESVAFAKARQASLAKPPESLGKLERIAIKLAGIRGKDAVNGQPLGRGCVITFCADNGVVQQGVASAPQSVTRAQTINFTRRLTGVGALAESFSSELLIVDVGVKDPIPESFYEETPFSDTTRIVDRRIRPGTWDISQGPAMTEDEALSAMETGIEMVRAAAEEGFELLGIGEMGIGNTTTSAAVLSALTGKDAHRTSGRGGGVNDIGFLRKQEIVDSASAEFRSQGGLIDTLKSAEDIVVRLSAVTRVLARCGGFDLCAMTGAYIGAAACRIPVVIDGYISVVAALAASIIAPRSKDYMFASHVSAEQGYMLAVEELGLDPFLDLDMRLGEGSGCPIAFSVIRGAWDVMNNMATFQEAEIDDEYLEEVRGNRNFRV